MHGVTLNIRFAIDEVFVSMRVIPKLEIIEVLNQGAQWVLDNGIGCLTKPYIF